MRKLPDDHLPPSLARKSTPIRCSSRVWWSTPLVGAVLLGDFLTLALPALATPYSTVRLRIGNLAWSGQTMHGARVILHCQAMHFQALSLLLNGAVLALSLVGVPA